MKKLISTILAALVICSSASFAFEIRDLTKYWQVGSPYSYVNVNSGWTTDAGEYGFGGYGYMNNAAVWVYESDNSPWLYDPNEVVLLDVDGIAEELTGNVYARVFLYNYSDGQLKSGLSATVSVANETLVLIFDNEGLTHDVMTVGEQINYIAVFGGMYDGPEGEFRYYSIDENMLSDYKLTLDFRVMTLDPDEPIVPEPASIAYGFAGLAPLVYLKKRTAK